MNYKNIFGIFLVILGLIFIIFPVFSEELVSVIVGVSLLFLGFAYVINAFSSWNFLRFYSMINALLGIIAIIFGLLFIFEIDALSFLVGLQFYIIAFIMIFFGILGLISPSKASKITSLLILLIGIIAVYIAVFTVAQPIYAAILIGVCLILEGLRFILVKN